MAGFGLLRELASKEPAGRWLYGLVQLANGFCVVFVLCQPLRSHYSPIILSLNFTHHFEV